MSLDEPLDLSPDLFFAFEAGFRSVGLPRKLGKGHLLPDLSGLSGRESFARLLGGWSSEGLTFRFDLDAPVQQSFFPDIKRGDGIELFIDSRDDKSGSYNTRFCHHFFFLPQEVDGQDRGEITRFRGEEGHDLADPSRLEMEVTKKKGSYAVDIFIPANCLHGFDGQVGYRLGFSYLAHRYGGVSQSYSPAGPEYQQEQLPWLWSTLRLEE